MTKPVLLLDFETFWDNKTYTLKKMSTESYILDARFEAIGCAVAFEHEDPVFIPKPELESYFAEIDWKNTIVAAHNARFDAAILAWRFGYVAGGYIDTQGIANTFVVPYTGKAGLDACFQYMRLPPKSQALNITMGMGYEQIVASGLWDKFADYATHDVIGVRELIVRYYHHMSKADWKVLSWTIDNYVRYRLLLDVEKLREYRDEVDKTREQYLEELEITKEELRSATKYAALLERFGFSVEYKKGKTGADIPAIAKDDPFMQKMLASPDPRAVQLAKARLLFSSNLEITRTQRLIEMAEANEGRLLVPLMYSAARTGRFGGADGVNVQNFGRASPIKKAVSTLAGKTLVHVDQMQIEARVLAYISGCTPLIEAFRDPKRDVYSEFASTVFMAPVRKETHPVERQVGKVSILQLGYQSGATKLKKKLTDAGVVTTEDQAEHYKDSYRQQYKQIPAMWREFQRMLTRAIKEKTEVPWLFNMKFTPKGIKLPAPNRWLLYDDLRLGAEGIPQFYDHRYKTVKSLYGGAITENVCQAIARDITNMTLVRFKDDAVMQVHDSVIRMVDEASCARELCATIEAMSTPPSWLHHEAYGVLPLGAEGYVSTTL